MQKYGLAEQDLKKAYALNQHDLDAMLALSRVAFVQKDIPTLESIQPAIQAIDDVQGEQVAKQINSLKQETP
ncbi:MAG TPA: hypothetical protein VNZ84_01570 [Methylophilus sp.]|nr:hypothetical protein [Methylophilus sp.]